MNCVPGDLAVIVRAPMHDLQHIGRLVVVTSLFEAEWWEFDAPWKDADIVAVRDECLRPIRDNPGTDQSLSWAPVPATKEPA